MSHSQRNEFCESSAKTQVINVEFVSATLKLSLEQLVGWLQVIREFIYSFERE